MRISRETKDNLIQLNQDKKWINKKQSEQLQSIIDYFSDRTIHALTLSPDGNVWIQKPDKNIISIDILSADKTVESITAFVDLYNSEEVIIPTAIISRLRFSLHKEEEGLLRLNEFHDRHKLLSQKSILEIKTRDNMQGTLCIYSAGCGNYVNTLTLGYSFAVVN